MAINCATSNLKKLYGDYCSPATVYGQIEQILIAKPGTTFANFAALAAAISNTADENTDPVRYLHVISSMPKPSRTESTISLGRKVYSEPKYSVPLKCYDVAEKTVTIGGLPVVVSNLEFARDLQSNPGASYLVWLVTKDKIIGGLTGIDATISMDLVIPESREEFITLEGTVDFTGILPDFDERPAGI